MKRFLALVMAVIIPLGASAEDGDTATEDAFMRPVGDAELDDFLWNNRLLLVFSDTPDDPRFQEQIKLLNESVDMLRDRDVIVLTDTDPSEKSPMRTRMRPRGFMLVLVGKDGVVEQRKPLPWTVREITRSIDKMPIRQREIRERRGSG